MNSSISVSQPHFARVVAMVKKTLEEFGKIGVLVNNVGWDKPQLFSETDPAFWDKVIALNYRSDLNCIKAVLPHMIERKGGSIVSIASDAASFITGQTLSVSGGYSMMQFE